MQLRLAPRTRGSHSCHQSVSLLTRPYLPPTTPPPPSIQQGLRPGKKKPQAKVRAVVEENDNQVRWTALLGGLARPADNAARATWRVHDKTHLEFTVDYPLGNQNIDHEWEAYFFVPESFRLDAATYKKEDIYDDLFSYVRYAVPPMLLPSLASRDENSSLKKIVKSLIQCRDNPNEENSKAAMRELRVFACMVRSAGITAARDVEQNITAKIINQDRITTDVLGFSAACAAVTQAMRAEIFPFIDELPDDVATSARWIDEDVSLVVETLCATLAVRIKQRARELSSLADVAASVAARAVAEARHRKAKDYGSVSTGNASKRDVEHIEFRRHVLKRFTASALWLSLKVSTGSQWVVHTLYAIAAAVAMAFALIAAERTNRMADNFTRYALAVAIAYAAKDRIKAVLQGYFSGWIDRRFPDRLWTISDDERKKVLGTVRERAGFMPFASLPEPVLSARRQTRLHSLEESARPESVLWHQKVVTTSSKDTLPNDAPSTVLTEIFRLNLRRWLDNTDDPKGKRVFADPEDAHVYEVNARRVYNINVVYRLRQGNDDAEWHRLRLVVSRRGINRIEEIALAHTESQFLLGVSSYGPNISSANLRTTYAIRGSVGGKSYSLLNIFAAMRVKSVTGALTLSCPLSDRSNTYPKR